MRCFYLIPIFFVKNALIEASIYENLRYFETLHADKVKHTLFKRDLKQSNHHFNEISFTTHGKDFTVILTQKRDHKQFYNGQVLDEIDSETSIHIDEGVITGTIHLPDETYHIEPSWRHLSHLDNRTMITYKASDVKLNWENDDSSEKRSKTHGYVNEGVELENTDDETWKRNHRRKRQINQLTKTRCPLFLVADYRFFQKMGGNNTRTTINYLISLIDRVNKIFNGTTWDDDSQEVGGFNGMGFVIKRILVHTEPTHVKLGEEHYNMKREKWDIQNLLQIFSLIQINTYYCLAHLFTHQTFTLNGKSTQGFGYVATPNPDSPGGICSIDFYKDYKMYYLNTGLSSSCNFYGKKLMTIEADLVTAHQFGHNWGAEDDLDVPECSPNSSQGGSYLMNSHGVSGYDFNNKRFSPCSVRAIKKVLLAKSARCFSERKESFCGDLIVEGDEECDPGFLEPDEVDYCCDLNCKLRRNMGSVCSDKNSACCQDCKMAKCRDSQISKL